MFNFNKAIVYSTLIALGTINGLNYATAAKKDTVKVDMQSKSDSKVKGLLTVVETKEGINISGTLTGLQPESRHGFHVHEKGDCSAPDAKSAGGHYDPAKTAHGGPNDKKSHAGDLGNIEADKAGVATINKTFKDLTLKTTAQGKHAIVDRAFVVHKKADDFKSQPSGDAGERVACGEITVTAKKK